MPRLEIRIAVTLDAFRLSVDLDLPLDGITVVFGPSGSGKTTLLRAIAGISPGTSGTVRFDGQFWHDDERAIRVPTHRRGLGFVFQDGRLFPHLSVRSNLAYGERRTSPEKRRIEPARVLDLLDLEPLLERRIDGLSGGERQRVAIGRALLASPRLLLMDEPLAAVDVARRGEILRFVEQVPAALGIPIVYVTHSIEEMLRLATRLVLIEQGRVAGHGKVEDLLATLERLTGAAELDPGTVVAGNVAAYDVRDGLAELHFEGGNLRVPSPPIAPGAPHRLRIRARDVALALEPPRRASFANVLAGRVVSLHDLNASEAEVVVDVGFRLHAWITRRSVRELGLEPGTQVYALVKATALDRPSPAS